MIETTTKEGVDWIQYEIGEELVLNFGPGSTTSNILR